MPAVSAGALAPVAGAPRRSDGAPRTAGERVDRMVAVHAHVWLLAGCAVGVLLASLLLSPGLAALLGPLSYGRWAALHLDLTLYGWIALPLLGLLLRAYGLFERPALASTALAAWSGALAVGAASWLAGRTSGKLFVDWTGGAAKVFSLTQIVVAGVLALGAWKVFREERAKRPEAGARRRLAVRWAGVGGLLAVPVALWFAERPDVYPAIDPASGGPTAASLLVSTLGAVALVIAAPRLAGLRAAATRGAPIAPLALAAHAAAWALAPGGDRDNRPGQLLLLASVAVWAVLVPWELRRFEWPSASRPWLRAAAGWGIALVVTGVAQFAAPLLARLKFTHALVAHAHIAVAGFSSAFVGALLRLRSPSWVDDEREDRRVLRMWNAALLVHVVALAALGGLEAADPAAVLRGGEAVTALFAVRWLAGVAMTVAVARWMSASIGESR